MKPDRLTPLLIMRHGAAEPRAASDAIRPLTSQGWQQTVTLARWLQQQPITVQYAWVSPYRRAQQTFEALHSVLPQLTQLPHALDLTPRGTIDPILEQLRSDDDRQPPGLLLISHMPLVGQLVSALCPHTAPPQFLTSTIIAIDLSKESGYGVKLWLQSPLCWGLINTP